MLRNYLTIAVRNLLKRKLYSFINIFGLATGVAVCLVILKYVDFELSYDSFHKNAGNIYRTVSTDYRNGELRGTNPLSGYAQGPSMLNDIPEVRTYIRTHPMYGGVVISNKDTGGEPLAFQEERVQFVDSTFLDVFTYPAINGNVSAALDRPYTLVLTESMAKKYFGDTDAVGKTLVLSGGWVPGDYEVTAVIRDVPQNSHFTFDFLLSIHALLKNGQYTEDDGWGWSNFVTYVELHPGTDPKVAESKLPAFIEKYRGKDHAASNTKVVISLQPIKNIHLSPGLDLESSATVSVNTIYFFIVISIFILAIAWVNYINLSTARAMERAREVGIKKAIGAYRSQLISQFAFEALLVNLTGVMLAVLIAVLLLPVLGNIVGKDFAFDFSDPRLWLVLVGLFVAGTFVSGGYPAFVLSSFKTTTVLKGSAEGSGRGFTLRKALVVFQFASSLILIAGTFAIYRQIFFMQHQDKGLNMEQILVLDGPRIMEGENRDERLITFKNELRKIPAVANVASSAAIPGGGFNWGTGMRRDGTERDESKSGNATWVDTDFISTYNISLLSGRVWNPDAATDMKSALINEAAIKTFGLGDPENALEQRLILGDGDTVNILGVLKNYHWNSLKSEHVPILLMPSKISGRNFSIHLTGNIQESLRQVEQQYKAAFPGNPFNYYFLDDFFNKQYQDDQQFGKIFSLFALLAIVIACLGLWGLAAFTTTLKLKEIGIRKVLGASVGSIMSLLSGQFLKLVFIASIIALPVTWYGIDTWLGNYAFRIGLEWDLFVIPVVILAAIALATVSVQILRGASINPAKVLRSE